MYERESLIPLLACSSAFLLGSIPFGLVIARVLRVQNLRETGSGNIGATNVSRVLGFWPAGFLTLVFDLFKGALPVLWLRFQPQAVSEIWIWAAALCAVVGHCYSPWLRFRGGKGVATGFGALLALSPWTAIGGALAFVLTFLATRTGSLSSLVGIGSAAVIYMIFYPQGSHLWMGAGLLGVILIRHEKNLDALLAGREKTFH